MKFQNFYIIMIILLTFSACTEKELDINFNTQIDSIPVIKGFITNALDSVCILLVWTSNSEDFDYHFSKIQNASVQLYEDENYVANFITDIKKDYYITYFTPSENKSYKIKCFIPEWNDSLFAVTSIPKHGGIKSIESRVITSTDDLGNLEYYILYHLRVIDPDTSNTNYFALGYSPYDIFSFNNLRYMIIDDPILGQWNEMDIASRDRKKFFVFTDENFQDSIDFEVRIWLNRYDNSRCDTPQIRFYLLTLSYEAYKDFQIYNSIQGEEIWDLPIGAFTEPIITFSNVENALGTFVGFSGDTTDVITEIICN